MKRCFGILSTVLLLAGCSLFQPVESPKSTSAPQVDLYQVLADAIKKSINITSGSFENNFDITFQNAPDIIDQFTTNLKGDWNSDAKKSFTEITFNLDLQNPEQSLPTHGIAKISLAIDNKKVIVRLNNINLVGEESEPINQTLKSVIGEWYLIPPNTSYPLDFAASLLDQTTDNKQILENGKYFQILDASMVQMTEEQAHHLVVTLDKDGTKAVLRKLQENNSADIAVDRLPEWESIIDNATFQGDIFIGKDSGFIRKLQGELTIIGSQNNNQQITISIDVELGNINEHVSVTVPRTQKTIDLQSLLNVPASLQQ